MPTRLEPTFDRVLIEKLPAETVTKGGIAIPEFSQNKPSQGYIRDMGPNVVRSADLAADEKGHVQTFDLGEKVMIGQYAGFEMTVDGVEYTLIKQDEIINKVIETPGYDSEGTYLEREHA